MDNVLETNGVPLTVFGGAVPELAPEDLPEGASPFNQDVDYNPGSVFTRAGRQNQITYASLFLDKNCSFAQSIPGQFAPNELPWTAPSNAAQNVPGTYASVTTNAGINTGNVVQFNQLFFNATTTNFVGNFVNPVTAGNAVFISVFVNDTNGGTEGVNCTACIDNKLQSADHIVANLTSNLTTDATFSIAYKSAVGGNQNYQFSITKQAGGSVQASRYAVCLYELTGLSNSGGADPFDQIYASVAGGLAQSQTTTINVATAQANELLIYTVQSRNNTAAPYQNPGAFYAINTPQSARIISDYYPVALGSNYYGEQLAIGQVIPSSPAAILTMCNSGQLGASMSCCASWCTVKQAVNNGVGALGTQSLSDNNLGTTFNGTGTSTTVSTPAVTPNFANEAVMYMVGTALSDTESNPSFPMALWGAASSGNIWFYTVPPAQTQKGVAVPAQSITLAGASSWQVSAFGLPTVGNAPPMIRQTQNAGIGLSSGANTGHTNANIAAGSSMLVCCQANYNAGFPGTVSSVTNSVGDVFQLIAQASNVTGGGSTMQQFIFLAVGMKGGNTDVVINVSGNGLAGGVNIFELFQGIIPISPSPDSQILQGLNYGFTLPSNTPILGVEVEVSGHQNNVTDPLSVINVSLPGATVPITLSQQLPAVDGTITFGTPLTNWGYTTGIPASQLDSPSFAVNVYASSSPLFSVGFFIYAIRLRVFYAPSPPANFNFMHTYEQTDAEIDTILLDSNGVLWDEDVDTNPGVLTSITQTILPNTFAEAVTFADIEYIAFSNLVNGTDVPRQWNGTNLDRISMVGPGAACTASPAGGSGGSNLTPISTIKQAAKVQIRRIAWGASINAQNDSTPGNVLVVSLPGGSTHGGNPPLNMNVGDTIVLSSITNPFPLKGGGSLPYNLNGTYTLLSSGTPIIGGGETDTAFTLQAPATAYGYSNDFGVPPSSGWFYQDTVATVTLTAPLPNVGVGSTIQINQGLGGPPTGFDGSWTVLTAPNASAMTITQVILVGGVATYTFTLSPGSAAPTVGQTVSVANVLNGNSNGPPGIFNVTNAQIQSVGANTFSINISNPGGDLTPAQSQVGNVPTATAQVAGTIFTFDPAQVVNSGNPTSGGNIIQQGLVATGQRKVCYSYLTRSGFITQPSPINTFNITSGSGGITVSGLSIGPSNVIARIVFFTGANGGNFFYIPQEVDITISGQPVQKNTSTIVNDNVSTSATFSFSDTVLLSATAIDIPGNNLFNCIELGSCRGLLTYASRMFAWSEQQKVTNLRNLSFDGGVNSANNEPLGWTPDPNFGTGGTVIFTSPVFGWCYQISSVSGASVQWGMITQNAWQDEFGVLIIQPSTLYSVRICALITPAGASTGNLVVDLFSASVGGGTALGTFSIPLSSMTTTMQIYTGTLLTTVLPNPTPKDLVIRIWAQNMPTGFLIQIDRVEPFPTLQPVNTTAFKGSYVNNQESFDLVTGVCGPSQNNQPINGGMVLFDLLYALKERSWYSTFDNGVTEPNKWNWKEVSKKVGTIGIYSYDWGEGWALTGNREGVFFFEGGEPIKVSQELQPLWDLINWQYGYTMWVRNDPEQRRFTVGVPIPTPNQYMPEFPVNANPTSPNVILMCNYRELNSGAALAQTGPIRSTYTGRLMSPEPARKWSFWNIRCPYSDYIDRANNQWPQWFGTGYQDSKVFQLMASQLSDDGNAINSFWISYGFVKPEAADAKGLGLFRMEFPYFTVLATGSGSLNAYVYPESPQNRPYVLDPQTLPTVTQGDLEIGVNIKGQRFFVRVGTNAVGAAFRCSKMVVPLIADTWSPVRGSNFITA